MNFNINVADFVKDLRVIFLSKDYLEFKNATDQLVGDGGDWTYFCGKVDDEKHKKWANDIDAIIILPRYQYPQTVREFFGDYYEV